MAKVTSKKIKLDKTKCNHCGTKFIPRVKSNTKGDITYDFAVCGTCKTVYPIFMADNEVKHLRRSLDRLRFQTFGADRGLLDVATKEQNVSQIYNLVQQIKIKSRQLILENKSLFESQGSQVSREVIYEYKV